MMFFGVLLGRLICGFLCPFGFIQDLLYKIPTPKLTLNKKVDKNLRKVKYVIGIVFVIVLPLFLTNEFGLGAPYFCKLICPAGTLEGGIPLVIGNESLRETIGLLFNWKMSILIFIILLSIFVYRPFCKFICPLGAFYGLFNKIGFYQMNVNFDKCINCGKCEKVCKMNVEVLKNINSIECIRCGDCKINCPTQAITGKFIK